MNPVADNPVIVPERELEEEKEPGTSEPPRIRCPLCGWSPRKEDLWSCTCGHEWNTFDTEASALRACTSGRRRSAFPAEGGLRTPTGMLID
jgi:hypothetical protein